MGGGYVYPGIFKIEVYVVAEIVEVCRVGFSYNGKSIIVVSYTGVGSIGDYNQSLSV